MQTTNAAVMEEESFGGRKNRGSQKVVKYKYNSMSIEGPRESLDGIFTNHGPVRNQSGWSRVNCLR